MKKLFIEISVVLSIAVLIALLYNLFSSKPLPWFTEKKNIKVIDDTILFGTTPDTSKLLPKDTIKNSLPKDTLQGVKSIPDTTNRKQIKDKIVPPDASAEHELKTLTYQQILKAMNNPKFLFVDARPPHEFEVSKIGNAQNVYPYDENQESYFRLLTNLPHDKIIIVYCSGGNCEASHKVVNDLKSFGYSNVYLYSGGWEDWTKHGRK